MNREQKENAARLYRRLAELGPSEDWVADTDELQRISRALGRIGERQCNEDVGDTLDKRERNLLAKAEKIAAKYGLRIYHQSDPRGWQVYLIPATFPQAEDDSYYNMRGYGVAS